MARELGYTDKQAARLIVDIEFDVERIEKVLRRMIARVPDTNVNEDLIPAMMRDIRARANQLQDTAKRRRRTHAG